MRSLPAELVTELSKENIMIFSLIDLTIEAGVNVKHWTDCDQMILYESAWYLPMGIKYSDIRCSINPEVGMVTLEIDNVSKEVSDIILATDLGGKDVTISLTAVDKSLTVINAPEPVFFGYVDSVKANRSKATFEFADELIKWRIKQVPGRIHSPTCRWAFNYPAGSGPRCAYPGAEEWCDQTWERCVELGNTINFGGFRWVSELSDKELWWGSLAKTWNKWRMT